ncbi:MAG: NADP transhydrogenase subunit alpha [Rickettsiales bacterium]|nr:NADP transhydrogenase subunit alpha [Rickettsiales bacterium]OUV54495.1 MAG: hypothetical protein CBC87_01135 [Rickettsiales bacterium TMED127]
MSKKIAVIGAGLAGITFAYIMKEKFNVKIFEKSRAVGGRMSTRKESPFIFDHGAQFFKIKTTECKNFFSQLFIQKIIQPWSFKLAYFEGDQLREIKIIEDADKFYVGVPNMDSILKYISRDCNVILNTKIERIKRKNDKWELLDQNKNLHELFDWVILSLPSEQSLDLISNKTSFYPNVKKIKMKGCYSLMVGMDKSLQLNFDAAFIENNDIAWLALNDSKPSRMKNHSLLINSSYEYATKNINTPKEKVLEHLLNISSNLINYDLFKSSMIKTHQWRYVEAECSPKENYFIDHENKIAVCGDWLINSRVEGAFLSANELSKEIA